MSVSPQIRQLFMEILARETPYFKKPDKQFDKPALLASVLHSLESEHPQHWEAFLAEAAHSTGKQMMIERFRRLPQWYRRLKGGKVQGSHYAQVPLGSREFAAKESVDLSKTDVARLRDYHDRKAESHALKKNWYAGIYADMEAAGLADDALAGEVLREAAAD